MLKLVQRITITTVTLQIKNINKNQLAFFLRTESFQDLLHGNLHLFHTAVPPFSPFCPFYFKAASSIPSTAAVPAKDQAGCWKIHKSSSHWGGRCRGAQGTGTQSPRGSTETITFIKQKCKSIETTGRGASLFPVSTEGSEGSTEAPQPPRAFSGKTAEHRASSRADAPAAQEPR